MATATKPGTNSATATASATGTIKQGDCIKQLAKLEAGSVDLAFADPPFNIGYDYDEYDDKRSADDYLDWSKKWMSAVVRVLKPDGTFWLAIGDEYAAELKVLATRELGLTCRSWVVWYYTFGVHCKTKFTRSHAHMFYFVKDAKRFTFNDAAVRVPSARQLVYGDKRANPKGRVPDDTWIIRPSPHDDWVLRPQDIPEAFTADSDTWFYSRVCGTFKERQGFHGCQMPERLLARIISACSNGVVGHQGAEPQASACADTDTPEPQASACADARTRKDRTAEDAKPDLVLDPFAGSGTTLAVAKKLGRRYVGIELSKQYAAECRKRLKGINIGDDLDGAENPLLSSPNTQNGTIRTADGKRIKQNGAKIAMALPLNRGRAAAVSRKPATPRQVRQSGASDLDSAINEAFGAVHRGFSTDWVLAEKDLNAEFTAACSRLAIPGGPSDWNTLLLRLRKAKRLDRTEPARRAPIDVSRSREYLFASEIALCQMRLDHGITLDALLCDPELAQRFDKLAAAIAPGAASVYYRWAALTLRKRSSAWAGFAKSNLNAWRPTRLTAPEPAAELTLSSVPERPGVYLLQDYGAREAKQVLYVGETGSLRNWLAARLRDGAFESGAFSAVGGQQILFRHARLFFPDLPHLRGLKSHLAGKREALWNHPELAA